MSITLELPPDVEARPIAQAEARGISVEELLEATINILLAASDASASVEQHLQSWIETHLVTETAQPLYQTATTAEWVDAFTTWAGSHSSDAPPLSDEAISRESIYREREDQQL